MGHAAPAIATISIDNEQTNVLEAWCIAKEDCSISSCFSKFLMGHGTEDIKEVVIGLRQSCASVVQFVRLIW